jgi:hypothetical protein
MSQELLTGYGNGYVFDCMQFLIIGLVLGPKWKKIKSRYYVFHADPVTTMMNTP